MSQTEDVDREEVIRAIERMMDDDLNLSALTAAVRPLTAAHVVDVLERLDTKQRAVLYRVLGKDQALEVFENLDPALQGDLVGALKDDDVATLFADLDPDDRVELLANRSRDRKSVV